ncbi:MAG: LysR family transcriptional regulator [Treponema sp.]|nr:LysR family transcriptional regulator [Treponema sp.]
MNLKHLSWFIELAKVKHFTKTAQKLYMDQSTLSKGIRALEEDLGVPLIDRTANVFRLTSHGEVLFTLGSETLEKVEDSLNYLRDSTAIFTGGVVRVGIPPVIGTVYFADVISEFEKAYPSIRLDVIEIGANIVKEKVDAGEIDIGIVILPIASGNYDVHVLFESKNVLVVNKEHPFAKRSKVRFQELKNEPMLSLDSSYMLYNRIVSLCNEAGFQPRFKLLSSQWDMVARMCELNYGVAILPYPILSHFHSKSIQLVELCEPDFPWDIAMVVRKDKYVSSAIRVVQDFVRKYSDS